MFHLHPLELTVSTFFPSITIPAGIYSPYLFYQLCFPATLFPYRIHPTAFHIHLFPLQKLLSVSGRGLPVLSAYAHIQQKLLHILLFSVIPAAVIDHLSERIVFRQVLFIILLRHRKYCLHLLCFYCIDGSSYTGTSP